MLAAPLGGLLKESGLGAGAELGIGWGRAIREIIRSGLPRIPGVLTVPATAQGRSRRRISRSMNSVRLAAEQLGDAAFRARAILSLRRASRDAFL